MNKEELIENTSIFDDKDIFEKLDKNKELRCYKNAVTSLEVENQKYKEVIDKVLEDIKEYKELGYSKYYENEIEIELIDKILKVLGND